MRVCRSTPTRVPYWLLAIPLWLAVVTVFWNSAMTEPPNCDAAFAQFRWQTCMEDRMRFSQEPIKASLRTECPRNGRPILAPAPISARSGGDQAAHDSGV